MPQTFLAQCINAAHAANSSGQYATAINWSQRALQRVADLPEAWYQLGIAFRGQGETAKATDALVRAAALASRNPDAQNSIALQLMELGADPEAERCLKQALALAPNYAFAHSNLGRLRAKQNLFSEAEAAFRKALALQPDLGPAYANLSGALNAQKRHAEAELAARRAIELLPHSAQAWSNLGDALHGLKRYQQAESAARRATDLDPQSAEAWSNLGTALHAMKRYAAAETAALRAIGLDPNSAEAWSNLCAALHGLKRHDAAESAARRAIELEAQSAEAWSNLGAALLALNRPEAAESAACRAIELEPRSSDAWSNLGAAMLALNRHEAARSAAQKAIEFDPQSAGAWGNLGAALLALRCFADAESAARRAIAVEPQSDNAWRNLAGVLTAMRRHEEAAACFAKCLEFDANAEFALGALLHSRMQICDWDSFEENLALLSRRVAQREKTSNPFNVLALTTDLAVQRKAAEIFAADRFPENAELGPLPGCHRHEKIRIGYFSADFRSHPVAFLMAEVFELHDRSKFELFGFSFGQDSQDDMRLRLSAAFDSFIDVREKSDRQVAELARELAIDIAIDLGGFTEDCRTGIFALRAAPIQASYIGYLGTMGAPYIDYLLADRIIVPEEHRQHYREQIVYLPSYQANDTKRRIAQRIFTRAELGLPESGFVFCCFNNNYKITPGVFAVWMRILQQVAGSVLFLYADNDLAAANLRKEAERRGVDGARLVFGKRLPAEDYLARYAVADLFLDTFTYNAGTTASDALWTGLPVLTCIGESFASRVAASLLDAIGLPELITTTEGDYESLAIALASDAGRLAQLKEKLQRNRLSTALFNTPLFVEHLEAAYTIMVERHEAGLPTAPIRV